MRATQSQSRSLFIRISGGDIFQIFNSQEGEFTFESASLFFLGGDCLKSI